MAQVQSISLAAADYGHPMSELPPPSLLWHYTTTPGLVGILVEHRLRATSVSFVNDPTEQRFGENAVLDALERIVASAQPPLASAAKRMKSYREHGLTTIGDQFGFANRMVACCSDAADSLDLWRAYGAEDVTGTYAVGIDPNVPLGPLFSEESYALWENRRQGDSMTFMRDGWRPMEYLGPDELSRRAEDLLVSGLGDVDLTQPSGQNIDELWNLVDRVIAELEARYKHPAYSAEREYRLQAELTSSRQFRVIPRAAGVSAFIELTTSDDGWGRPTTVAARLPVREVILWPGAPPQAFSGVSAALTAGGHDHSPSSKLPAATSNAVQVRRSVVPFV